MGNGISRFKRNNKIVCKKCGYLVSTTGTVRESNDNQILCPRCGLNVFIDFDNEPIKFMGLVPISSSREYEQLFRSSLVGAVTIESLSKDTVYKMYDLLTVGHLSFKISSMHPYKGKVDENTRIFMEDPNAVIPQSPFLTSGLFRIKLSPSAFVLDRTFANKDFKRERSLAIYKLKRDLFKPNHKNAIFELHNRVNLNNIEFIVTEITPKYGCVVESTIVTVGDPFLDIEKVEIRPTTIGNSEQVFVQNGVMNEREVFDFYLKEYFMSRVMFIKRGTQFNVKGVTFYVSKTIPPEGVITNMTKVYVNTEFVRFEYLRYRFTNIQELNNAFSLLASSFPMIQQMNRNVVFLETSARPLVRKVNPEIYPTRKITEKDTKDSERKSCRVCLEDFKVEEVVSLLPCVHFYHENCIAEWFKIKSSCPVCNTKF